MTTTQSEVSATLDPGVVLRAYRVQLDPTNAQVLAYQRHAGAARAAYNFAIAAKQRSHRRWLQEVAFATYAPFASTDPAQALEAARKAVKVPIPGSATLAKDFRVENPWCAEVDTYAFSTGLRQADTAWKNWLASAAGQRKGARVGYPRFHRKGRARETFTLFHDIKKPTLRPGGPVSKGARAALAVKGVAPSAYRHLNLPAKVGGPVRLQGNIRRLARRIRKGAAVITSVTISRHGHKWWASILARETLTLPTKPTPTQERGGAVGVDVGVKALAVLSTGNVIENPAAGRAAAQRLARAQRDLARTRWVRESDGALISNPKGVKCRPSARRLKAQHKVSKLYALLAEQRSQTLHRLTKDLATSYELVAIEDLNVAGMTRSAKGTAAQPGKNVRAKSGLNREILDVSFGELRRQLTYKTQWYGSRLEVIGRFLPTSKTCATCGWKDPLQTLAQRTLTCPRCGPVDRDLNAARNVLAAALGQFPPVAPENEETKNARGARPSPGHRPAGRARNETGNPKPSHGQGYRGVGNPPPVHN